MKLQRKYLVLALGAYGDGGAEPAPSPLHNTGGRTGSGGERSGDRAAGHSRPRP